VSGPPDKLIEVIGVSADAAIAEPHAMNQVFVFTPLLQEPSERLERQPPTLLLKPSGDRHNVEQQARRTVVTRGSDDILDLRSLQETADRALMAERLMRLGALYFAGLTTLLVFVGLYAVLNLDIVRRVPEIGLRLALGASTQNIQWMVTRNVLITTGAGLAVGVPAAFLAGRLVASSLTLVAATDPVALVGAPVLILAICTVSAVAPLRRASRVTPVEALASQ
jgi:ABC-type lipoprotein release transport system permease subunit